MSDASKKNDASFIMEIVGPVRSFPKSDLLFLHDGSLYKKAELPGGR